MTKLEALDSFWNGFGLRAYDEAYVPDSAILPYITYEGSSDSFGEPVAQTVNLWYRSSSWEDVQAKETEISAVIGRGGKMISYDNGVFWITKGSPWAQRMGDNSDDMIRRIVLNTIVEYID